MCFYFVSAENVHPTTPMGLRYYPLQPNALLPLSVGLVYVWFFYYSLKYFLFEVYKRLLTFAFKSLQQEREEVSTMTSIAVVT